MLTSTVFSLFYKTLNFWSATEYVMLMLNLNVMKVNKNAIIKKYTLKLTKLNNRNNSIINNRRDCS